MRRPRAEFAPPNRTASSIDVIYRQIQRVPTDARSEPMPTVPKQEQILLNRGQRAVTPRSTKVNGPSEAELVTVNRTPPRPGRSGDEDGWSETWLKRSVLGTNSLRQASDGPWAGATSGELETCSDFRVCEANDRQYAAAQQCCAMPSCWLGCSRVARTGDRGTCTGTGIFAGH